MRPKDYIEDIPTAGPVLGGLSRSREPAAELTHSIVQRAIEALWALHNRPSLNGESWAASSSRSGLSTFAAGIAKKPGFLLGLCRNFHDHPSLLPQDAEALRQVLAIADALTISDSLEYDCGFDMNGESKRSEFRTEFVQSADFRHGETQYKVDIRNLSSKGVMIDGAPVVSVGDQASVRIDQIGWVGGLIAWSIEGRCGLAFDRPIDVKLAGLSLS